MCKFFLVIKSGVFMHHLRFRQVHLDFHTSAEIFGIGTKFDKRKWQKRLKDARINSITIFALCHHGYSYYDTKIGVKHPNLKFDLLKEQFDACNEININTPIYLSVGVNWISAIKHPEWIEITKDGETYQPIQAKFRKMCFNTPYLVHICEQIKEVVTLFPKCDGIFLDIIRQGECCCTQCMASMLEKKLDPENEEDRKKHSRLVLEKYYSATTAAAKFKDKNMPIFHNSGHISPAWKNKLKYFSHLELESLPTGGWGYDHFPRVAKYCSNLKLDFLGMTGKFHTTWGELGGYKHPDALRYECAAMLAMGAKCSIGDQLHPSGKLDSSTYRIIGKAYKEVESKEPWCDNVKNVADIGLFSVESVNDVEFCNNPADIGASRLLLEGHFLFDIIDTETDISKYKMVILPDEININITLKKKLDAYLERGGKILLTGSSGLNKNKSSFLWDIGAEYMGENNFRPDYVLPAKEFNAKFMDSPVVMYFRSQKIKVKEGKSCGKIFDPYFNRSYKHFCSHQHTPYKLNDSGFDCGVINNNIMYLAHPVFTNYYWYGAFIYKEFITKSIKSMLGKEIGFKGNLPSQARISLMNQRSRKRYVFHLLYANKLLRGGENDNIGDNIRPVRKIEVIEGIEPLFNVNISLFFNKKIKRITLEPQNKEIFFDIKTGRIEFTVKRLFCHQMIVLYY